MDISIYDNIRNTRFAVHGHFFIPNARILIFYVTPNYIAMVRPKIQRSFIYMSNFQLQVICILGVCLSYYIVISQDKRI